MIKLLYYIILDSKESEDIWHLENFLTYLNLLVNKCLIIYVSVKLQKATKNNL